MVEITQASLISLNLEEAEDGLTAECKLGDQSIWVEIKMMEAADGSRTRLLSHTSEPPGPWSFTVDVRTTDGRDTALLRTVHVLRRSSVHLPEEQQAVSCSRRAAVRSSCHDDAVDAEQTIAELSSRSYMLHRLTGRADVPLTRQLLSDILSGEVDAPEHLLRESTWQALACGCGLSVQPESSLLTSRPDAAPAVPVASAAEQEAAEQDASEQGAAEQEAAEQGAAEQDAAEQGALQTVREELARQGVGRLLPVTADWAAAGVSIDALARGIEHLRQAGLPPAFLFMFNEPWMLADRCGELLRPVMGEEAELDEAVFAWALAAAAEADGADAAAAPPIGSNFGRPHRDASFDASHTACGDASELTVWVALTPCTTSNGCMLVVPSQHDPLFRKSSAPLHMQPDKAMPWAHVRPLTCEAGTILIWHASLIHWGTACDAGEPQPRKSVGCAFKLPAARGRGRAAAPRVTRQRLAEGLSVRERLRLVMQTLLKYEHWAPRFGGLDSRELAPS